LGWQEGSAAANSDFQLSVAYVGPNGETNLKIITFTGDTKYAYTLDRFGEPIQFIAGKADNLVVTANNENNKITLGNGNDTIKGSEGADTINGGGGKDTVDYSASTDPVSVNIVSGVGTGGQANRDQLSNIEILKGSTTNSDTLDFSGAGTPVNVNFITGTTNQKLNGSDENLTFSGFENAVGSANDDTFVANSAANKFNGGGGKDTVDFSASTAPVTLNVFTGLGTDGHQLSNIEILKGSSVQGDTLDFSGATAVIVNFFNGTTNQKLNGSSENLTFSGFENAVGSADADEFVANSTANKFNGGEGSDTVSYANSPKGSDNQGVIVNLSDKEASYVGHNGVIVKLKASSGTDFHASGDTYASIENVIGSAGNDIFIASSVSNTFNGGVGGSDTVTYAGLNIGIDLPGVTVNLEENKGAFGSKTDKYTSIDNVTGSAGQDVLRGDANNNVLMGGDGADQFFGGGGTDTVSYQDSPTGVSIDMDNTTLGAGRGTGFAKGDVIANGVERILGSNGNDTFFSTRSDVVLDGGTGFDSIDFLAATTGVTVNLGDTNKFDRIERVVGSNHDDKLTASNSGSTLVARGGNDTLIGGNGVDFLDLVTGNSTPNSNGRDGDEASAGAGSDTVWIDARNLTGNEGKLDGGTAIKRNLQTNADTDTDTLRVIAGATLDLGSLNAVNFERVDLRADGGGTQVSLSSADIRALVNSGTGNNVLTLRLDSNDSYVIDAATGETVVQGQSVSFYNGSIASTNLVAQVNFEYA
jgi:Ca2+-binding RTX toxin-like protein